MPFVAAYINELVFLFQSLASPSCHSARRACPELQNSLFNKRRKPSLLGKDIRQTDEGVVRKCFCLAVTQPTSATVPPLPEGEDYLLDDGFCDFAFGSAQNDRSEAYPKVKVFRSKNPTKRKSVAISIDFRLMLCASVLD